MGLIDLLASSQITSSPVAFYWFLFKNGGWVFFVIGFIYLVVLFILEYQRGQYDSKRRFICLAIDVPKTTEQSPKAAEQIFASLAGTQTIPKWGEKWIKGEMPESFSLEIISLGGYIQFLIQTHAKFRDLVEAAVYAQYPDAEIVEVEDYTAESKKITFPNDEYELWGTEFSLTNKEYYPIKTYFEFEHPLSGEFKDPMAALLEVLSKIGPDEQIWLQLAVTPAPDSWKEPVKDLVKKLIGAEVKRKRDLADWLVDPLISLIGFLGDMVGGSAEGKRKDTISKPPTLMQHLSPGERKVVEAIENKASKIGFHCRFRFIYLAKKESFNKPVVNAVSGGAIKQFNTLNLNGFKPNKLKFLNQIVLDLSSCQISFW